MIIENGEIHQSPLLIKRLAVIVDFPNLNMAKAMFMMNGQSKYVPRSKTKLTPFFKREKALTNPLPKGTLEPMRTTDLQCRFCGFWFEQDKTRHYCIVMGSELTFTLAAEVKH